MATQNLLPQAGVPSSRREYLRNYQRTWIKQRRQEWINQNGPCTQCGSDDRLEVDHVEPTEKQINPRSLWGMSRTNPRRLAELAKCQVLCRDCHKAKTRPQIQAKAFLENLTRQRNSKGQFLSGAAR